MGYYTKHKLIFFENDFSDDVDHEKGIAEQTNGYSDCFGEEIKWYDMEESMINYSKKYPNIVFCIEGEGEESGDNWRHYFKNGKSQKVKAKITYEPYDESKLK